MKKIVALFLTLILIFGVVSFARSTDPSTPTDLKPVETEETVPETEPPVGGDSETGPPEQKNYTITLSNLSSYNLVALYNANLNGHVRGSIWVGGTLTGGEWKFVDDGSVGHTGAGDSYVAINESGIQFKSRTSEQGTNSYYGLTDSAISSTRAYWKNLITNIGFNDTWIYVAPDENGHVDMQYWDYQCPGSDESHSSIAKIYWTDATTVTLGGLAGHLIAPYATVTIVNCNHCGSVVAKNINTTAESHINYWNPPTPPDPTPTPTPDPTPTPKPITVTKVLKGEIWSVRCDTMDNTDFKAGGGYWMADITNSENVTSKEGHRSNHCGNADNWVLFVSEDGVAISLYQLKSGSTGGTLPSIMYRAPADLASIPEGQLIYDPTDPNDEMTSRLMAVFQPSNVMPFSEINLQEGQRLFWISQNGKQVWHHTGVLRKTAPKFAIVINGVPYSLGVNESITLTDIEEGLVQVEEIATANYKLHEIQRDEEGNVVVVNEIDPPDKPTPTPPPPIVTNTPTPTPEETTPPPADTTPPVVTETPTPTPTPTPTVSPTPSPTPTNWCTFTIKKVVDADLINEPVVFFFEITGVGLDEPMYIEITVDPDTGIGTYTTEKLKAGKYTVKEIDVPDGYYVIGDDNITLYCHDDIEVYEFKNGVTTPTPSPIPTSTPTPTPSPTPSPTLTPAPTETPTLTPTPTPTPTPTLAPTPTPFIDEEGHTWTYEELPTQKPNTGGKPKQRGNWHTDIDDYDTALGVGTTINHVGDCFD